MQYDVVEPEERKNSFYKANLIEHGLLVFFYTFSPTIQSVTLSYAF
jgi:hypothetical protein